MKKQNLKETLTAVFTEIMTQIIKNPIGVPVEERNIVKGLVNGLYIEVSREVNSENIMPHFVYSIRDIYGLPLYSIPMEYFSAEDEQHRNFASLFTNAMKACNAVIREKHRETLGIFNNYESDVIENHYK